MKSLQILSMVDLDTPAIFIGMGVLIAVLIKASLWVIGDKKKPEPKPPCITDPNHIGSYNHGCKKPCYKIKR